MSSEIDFFVLDCLADDIEDIEQISQMLNDESAVGWRRAHGGPFQRAEIVLALIRGIRRGNIEACIFSEDGTYVHEAGEGVVPDGDLSQVWFRMTKRGRLAWGSWTPSVAPNPWASDSRA